MAAELTIAGVAVTFEEGIPHLDLRHLQPPQPAVAILAFLARPEAGNQVIVRLPRDPIFLYPELAERGWAWEPLHAEAGDFRLRLFRQQGNAPR